MQRPRGHKSHILLDLIKTNYIQALYFLFLQCIWRVTRLLPVSITELNLSQALLQIHVFIDTHPTSSWKSRPDDAPLRTIKTVLHSLIKLKGDQVSKVVDQLPVVTWLGVFFKFS